MRLFTYVFAFKSLVIHGYQSRNNVSNNCRTPHRATIIVVQSLLMQYTTYYVVT